MFNKCQRLAAGVAILGTFASGTNAWAGDSRNDCPLRAKIGQMIMTEVPNGSSDGLRDFKKFAVENNIGGVILYEWTIESGNTPLSSANDVITFTNYLQKDMPTPMFVSLDQEGGMVQRLNASRGFTQLPKARRIGDINKDKLAFDFGRIMGEELAAVGINFNLAPDTDIKSNPNNSVIAGSDRAISTDPEKVARLGAQIIRGLEGTGVLATAKHFPGHGSTSGDSHDDTQPVQKSLQELMDSDLLPFIAAVKNNVSVIMVGHLSVPQICGTEPASLSHELVTNLLRKKLNFNGLVMSDDMTMGAITKNYPDFGDAVERAIMAGDDLLLLRAPQERQMMAHLCQATTESDGKNGLTKKAKALSRRIEESYDRILKAKRDHKIVPARPLPLLTQPLSTDEHRRIASKILELSNLANPAGASLSPLLTPAAIPPGATWQPPSDQLMTIIP